MAQLFGFETGLNVPAMAASSIGWWVLVLLVSILVMGVLAFLVWIYLQRQLYKTDIVVFENIAGQGWNVAYKDKARFFRLSKDGTEVFMLKKKKIPLTAYGKKMGHNQYWFAIGQDGGWYNFVLGDLDAKMGTLDIELIDRDIKYISVAMRKNAAENYGPKQSWFDKHGVWVMGGITLVVIFVGLYFCFEQLGNGLSTLAAATDRLTEAQEPTIKALGYVDTICSGGTGITPA